MNKKSMIPFFITINFLDQFYDKLSKSLKNPIWRPYPNWLRLHTNLLYFRHIVVWSRAVLSTSYMYFIFPSNTIIQNKLIKHESHKWNLNYSFNCVIVQFHFRNLNCEGNSDVKLFCKRFFVQHVEMGQPKQSRVHLQLFSSLFQTLWQLTFDRIPQNSTIIHRPRDQVFAVSWPAQVVHLFRVTSGRKTQTLNRINFRFKML